MGKNDAGKTSSGGLACSMYQKIRAWKNLAEDYELLKRENQYYRDSCREKERQEEEVRKIRHDLSNLYILQLSYLENGEYGKLRRLYLDTVNSLSASDIVIHTGNIGFDSIVSFKLEQAVKQKLTIKKEIRIGGRILVDDRDINSLMGNLFDNALEACNRIPEDRRKIRIRISSDEVMLYFEIANSFDGQLRKDPLGKPLTRKADRKKHGIGLKTVKRIVKKYHGDMQIRYRENWFEVRGLLYFRNKTE